VFLSINVNIVNGQQSPRLMSRRNIQVKGKQYRCLPRSNISTDRTPTILVLISSASVYWFAYAGVTNIIVGGTLFEISCNVQYLTIVWLFNRRRVDKVALGGGLVGFVFRRSGVLVGVYVGLVLKDKKDRQCNGREGDGQRAGISLRA
jgi:hypothetical protein